MKKWAGFFILVLCWSFSGCAQSAFNAAVKKDTINAYEQYLSKYPDGEYSNNARHRIVELAFEDAEKQDTVSAYDAFLKQFPQSPYSETASYKKAQKEDTVEAYTQFLTKYPNGEWSLTADQRREELWFKKAQHEDTIDSYEDFLKHYSEGEMPSEAIRQVERLCYEKALEEGTVSSCEEFLKKFPQSRFSEEIKSKLSDLQIPLLIKTEAKFSKWEIKLASPEPAGKKGKKTDAGQPPDGRGECKVDTSESHVQGVIETTAIEYGKQVSSGVVKVVGIRRLTIDGQEKYFLICKYGKLLRSFKRRPEVKYKDVPIKYNPSRYTVAHDGQTITLTAERERETILFPLNFDPVHCKVYVDKDAVPLPPEKNIILRPKF